MKYRLNKHIILIVLLLVSFSLFSFLFLRIYQRDQQNLNYRYLQHQFDPEANTAEGSDQYLERVPMENMDFAALGIDAAYAPLGYNPYTLTATLSEDLTYYREVMGVKFPALTLKKGSVISIEYNQERTIPFGYGYTTYPTYERGWRYAIPFQTGSEPYTGKEKGAFIVSQEEAEYYYVRLSDIQKILRLFAEADLERKGDTEYDSKQIEETVYNNLLNIDNWLASGEIYLSPDLGGSVIEPSDYLLAGVSATCLVGAIFLLVFHVRKKKTDSLNIA